MLIIILVMCVIVLFMVWIFDTDGENKAERDLKTILGSDNMEWKTTVTTWSEPVEDTEKRKENKLCEQIDQEHICTYIDKLLHPNVRPEIQSLIDCMNERVDEWEYVTNDNWIKMLFDNDNKCVFLGCERCNKNARWNVWNCNFNNTTIDLNDDEKYVIVAIMSDIHAQILEAEALTKNIEEHNALLSMCNYIGGKR